MNKKSTKDKEVKPVEKIVPKVKMVKVNVTHPFRFAKKECNSNTKTLPEGVANWMVRKNYGKIL